MGTFSHCGVAEVGRPWRPLAWPRRAQYRHCMWCHWALGTQRGRMVSFGTLAKLPLCLDHSLHRGTLHSMHSCFRSSPPDPAPGRSAGRSTQTPRSSPRQIDLASPQFDPRQYQCNVLIIFLACIQSMVTLYTNDWFTACPHEVPSGLQTEISCHTPACGGNTFWITPDDKAILDKADCLEYKGHAIPSTCTVPIRIDKYTQCPQ